MPSIAIAGSTLSAELAIGAALTCALLTGLCALLAYTLRSDRRVNSQLRAESAAARQVIAALTHDLHETWAVLPTVLPMPDQNAVTARELAGAIEPLTHHLFQGTARASKKPRRSTAVRSRRNYWHLRDYSLQQEDFDAAGCADAFLAAQAHLGMGAEGDGDHSLAVLWQRRTISDLLTIIRTLLFQTWDPDFKDGARACRSFRRGIDPLPMVETQAMWSALRERYEISATSNSPSALAPGA